MTDCEELLFSQRFAGSILIGDSSFYQCCGNLVGDDNRKMAIKRINSQYCLRVIEYFFYTKQLFGDLEYCLTFLAHLKMRDQRAVMESQRPATARGILDYI
jgi:hypothetical protein